MSDRATRFMRENTFGLNLVVHGSMLADGRIKYRMQDGTVHRITESDREVWDRANFTPRFAPGVRFS